MKNLEVCYIMKRVMRIVTCPKGSGDGGSWFSKILMEVNNMYLIQAMNNKVSLYNCHIYMHFFCSLRDVIWDESLKLIAFIKRLMYNYGLFR